MSNPHLRPSTGLGPRIGVGIALLAMAAPWQASALDPVIDSAAGTYSVRLPVDSGPYIVWSDTGGAPPQPPAGGGEALYAWRLATPTLIATLGIPTASLPQLLPLTGLKAGVTNSVSIATLAAQGTQGPWSEAVRFKPDPLLTALPQVMKYFDHAILRWADYDRDGDLDLFLSGMPYGGLPTAHRPDRTYLYRNDGNGFAEVRLNIPCVFGTGDIQFGDYDNDGDLDLVIAGYRGDINDEFIGLYRNDGGDFVPSGQSLRKAQGASMAWGDYDNDGDLDLLLSGSDGVQFVLLYRNDGGNLVESGIDLPAPGQRLVRMLDYDGDGRLDLVLGALILRNSGTGFTQVEDLVVMGSQSIWMDSDKDGDWDAMVGTKLYRNDSGNFRETPTRSFEGIVAAWMDLDADDTLDVLTVKRFYRGADTGFISLPPPFTIPYPLMSSRFAHADFDSDGDPDLAICASDLDDVPVQSRILRNNSVERRAPRAPGAKAAEARAKPAGMDMPPPTGLTAVSSGDSVTLSWTPPEAALAAGLPVTYNLATGTTPGGIEVVSPMADPQTGQRYLPAPGNAFRSTKWKLGNLPMGRYFWRVQVVDGKGQGGRFSALDSFSIGGTTATGGHEDASMPFRIGQTGGRLEARFTLAAASDLEITLLLPSGKLLARQAFPALPPGSYRRMLNTRLLPQGLYLAVLRSNGRSRAHRFVVAP